MTFFQYLLVYLIKVCFGYNMNYTIAYDKDSRNLSCTKLVLIAQLTFIYRMGPF